ncbi:hypothetical protein KR222_003895 [Zaprionus bogoriensis]|nr:hypothetical protein KR222_003895 [Zaprionus bogoriensis]
MFYESSYESGRKPFSPDQRRGKWENPTDYIFACCGLALKLDLYLVSYWWFFDLGLYGIVPYFIYMVIYLVPIMVMHSFVGQFSSSGFISAFRLSPIFKGMSLGYVSLIWSLANLLYYSIFAVVPLIFVINSLRPTMPWSCTGMEHFNLTTVSTRYAELKDSLPDEDYEDWELQEIHVPSVLYFRTNFEKWSEDTYELSWRIAGYTILIWTIIIFIFYKFSETPKFGRLLRLMVLLTLGLLALCFVRILFLPGALAGLTQNMTPKWKYLLDGSAMTTICVLQSFGSGWGSVITLSSFNSFRTNVVKYNWIIGSAQLLVYIMFGTISYMINHRFQFARTNSFGSYTEFNWVLYLAGASHFSSLELPHIWTFLYYTMLLLAALIVMITQIFTVLTSLFDEFEVLRQFKQKVKFGLLVSLALCSIFCCMNHVDSYFSTLSLDAIFSNSVMHLVMLLAVLWVYGRERFQRDIEFMLGQPFSSIKVFILRFIAPLFLLCSLTSGFLVSSFEHTFSSFLVFIISFLLLLLPFLLLPGYGVYVMLRNTGGFCERLRRACRPTDWYPVEMENRQKYEEMMGNCEMTHQLHELSEHVH